MPTMPLPEAEREDAPEGVRSLDHTADVGLDVEADSLPELFVRAGRGALWLALGERAQGGSERRTFQLEAGEPAGLLRSWLRELLYLQEVEGFAAADFDLEGPERLDPGADDEAKWAVAATLTGGPAPQRPLREIKGVTWHGLEVREEGDRWHARVIFDV